MNNGIKLGSMTDVQKIQYYMPGEFLRSTSSSNNIACKKRIKNASFYHNSPNNTQIKNKSSKGVIR
jgi:hypothetical protein